MSQEISEHLGAKLIRAIWPFLKAYLPASFIYHTFLHPLWKEPSYLYGFFLAPVIQLAEFKHDFAREGIVLLLQLLGFFSLWIGLSLLLIRRQRHKLHSIPNTPKGGFLSLALYTYLPISFIYSLVLAIKLDKDLVPLIFFPLVPLVEPWDRLWHGIRHPLEGSGHPLLFFLAWFLPWLLFIIFFSLRGTSKT